MLFAILVNSLLMTIVFSFYKIVSQKINSKLSLLFLVSLWISFEKFHLNWDFSWPWLNLGNVFSEKTSWIQWYEYTGSFGGTLWVLAINIFIYLLIDSKIKSKKIILSFVGPLQTNKSEDVINQFHEVQSLDRLKLVKSLSKSESKLNKRLNYMVQVNTGNEEQKSGIRYNEVDAFYNYCSKELDLNVIGLMVIPPNDKNTKKKF